MKTWRWHVRIMAGLMVAGSLRAQPHSTPTSRSPETLIEAAQLFLNFRQGAPANPRQLQSSFQRFEQLYQQMMVRTSEISKISNVKCQKFLATYRNLQTQVFKILRGLAHTEIRRTPDTLILMQSRLQVLMMTGAIFTRFIENGSEGGGTLLNTRVRDHQCSVSDRRAWVQETRDLSEVLGVAVIGATGVPGLVRMLKTEDHLEQLVKKKSRDDRILFGLTLGLGFVLSCVVWEMAPFIAATYLKSFAALSSGAGLLTLRMTGISAEMLAYRELENRVLFVEDAVLRDNRILLTWTHFLDSVDDILRTPLNSPRLYYDALAQLHGRLSSRVLDLLGPWRSDLERVQRQFGSVDAFLQQMEPTYVP